MVMKTFYWLVSASVTDMAMKIYIYIFYEILIANKIKPNSLLVFRSKWFVYGLRGVNASRTSLKSTALYDSMERDYVIKILYWVVERG